MNPVIPRFFPQLQPLLRLSELTKADFATPRVEIPQTQNALGPSEKTPAPAREVLMATALAYQGPIIAKMFIEEDEKKESEVSYLDHTLAV